MQLEKINQVNDIKQLNKKEFRELGRLLHKFRKIPGIREGAPEVQDTI